MVDLRWVSAGNAAPDLQYRRRHSLVAEPQADDTAHDTNTMTHVAEQNKRDLFERAIMRLAHERDTLRAENQELREENERLRQENERLLRALSHD